MYLCNDVLVLYAQLVSVMNLFERKFMYIYKLGFSLLALLLVFACSQNISDKTEENPNVKSDKKYIDSVFHSLTDYANNYPDSAENLALFYEQEFIRDVDNSSLIRLYSFLSELYQYRKNDDFKALNYIIKALDKYSQFPETEFDNTYLYVNAGNILYRYEMFSEAIYVYHQTKKVADHEKHKGVFNLIDNNIGLAYQEMGNCDSAMHYFNLAESEIYFDGIKTYIKKVQSNYYKISLSLNCRMLDSIPYYFNENSRMFSLIDRFIEDKNDTVKVAIWNDIKMDYYVNKVRSINAMADYYYFLGQDVNAERLYREALGFAKLSGDLAWVITVYLGWADVSYKLNNFYDCQQILDSALVIAYMTNSDFDKIADIYGKMVLAAKSDNKSLLSRKFENLSEAYRDSALQNELSGEIVSKRIELAIKPVELTMQNVELRRNEILQNYEIKFQLAKQKEETVRYRHLFFTGLLVLFLGISLFLLYRNRARKKLAEVSLEISEREKKLVSSELQNFSMHISYKNDFLREVLAGLKIMSQEASDGNKPRIKELNFKITQSLNNSKESKIIEEKIKEINSGFFFNLSEKFPDLTENDKNLCALVKMNLSSKEIASIKNISERSVITARYRLRRKLNMDNDENLTLFLNRF